MSLWDHPPLHDFPDRAFRELLRDPGNLRNLLAAIVPHLVDRLDFSRLETVPRSFLLDDWRRREADLFFRLPWLAGSGDDPPLLVCLLIEHQSEADLVMPLRVLLYAVLYWQSEWKAWEQQHPREQPLCLSPIVPIVFHTGEVPWRTHQTLATLIRGPEELAAFVPRWEPLFWDLAQHSTTELLDAVGEFLAALAVVRGEKESEAAYRELFAAVLRRLEGLSERDRVRWQGLLWFVLSWALRRRSGQEREALLEAAQESQAEVSHRDEVRRMSDTIAQTWEQELLERGKLLALHEILRQQLEEKFGPLAEDVVRRIEAIQEADRLREALRQVVHVTSLTQLHL